MELIKDGGRMCTMSPEERFDIKYSENSNGCWEWLGNMKNHRTATFMVRGEKYPASKFSYERFVGPVPKGMFIQKTCNNSRCVNPKHLILSQSATGGKTLTHKIPEFCRRGHKYEPVYRPPGSGKNRACRECRAEDKRNTKQRARVKYLSETLSKYNSVNKITSDKLLEHSVQLDVGHCVYFLFDDSEIVYIGRSGNGPFRRLADHLMKKKMIFDKMAFTQNELERIAFVNANRMLAGRPPLESK